jgi:hypothetical protein
VNEVNARRSELYGLAESNDPEATRLILDQFVESLTANMEKETVEGVLLDPRSIEARYLVAPRGVEPLFRP